MAIKDRVIYDLERCVCKVPDACSDCSKRREGLVPLECMEELMKDALELLKRQEASFPEMELFGNAYRAYRCPNCHKALFYQGQKFCDDCGKAVKWE